MGFCDKLIVEGAGYSSRNFMDLLEDNSVPVYYGNGSLLEVALEGVAESEENWNNIMKACAYTELANYKMTGEEYVFSEAAGTGFIAKAKAFFLKIWEKIKSLFKRFAMMLGSFTKSDKDFITKYKKDIGMAIGNIPSDAKYKGYNYTVGEFEPLLKQALTKAQTKIFDASAASSSSYTTAPDKDYDSESKSDEARGAFLGKSDGYTASEFNKELFAVLRNGEESPEEFDFTGAVVTAAMSGLEGQKAVKKLANDSYTILDKYFTSVIRALEKKSSEVAKSFPNDAENNTNSLVNIQRAIAENRTASGIASTANGIFLTALKDYSRQMKAICVKVVGFKTKHEGYSFDHYTEGAGFLESVVLK